MNDRTCVITGASSGIGKATALALAQTGVKLVLICRDSDHTQKALAEIRRKSKTHEVELLHADLSSQDSVRNVASEFHSRYGQIHILIHNAGIATRRREVSIDGLEMTFAVNHLAPFLLTHLLLDRIKNNVPSRIIFVSSEAHRNAKFDLTNLQSEKNFSGFGAYCITKLCNILTAYELNRRLHGTSITVNAMHPGYLRTAIFREAPGFLRFLVLLTAGSPNQGARALLHLSTAPELASVSGKYFRGTKEISSSKTSYDEMAAKQLWKISTDLTGVIDFP